MRAEDASRVRVTVQLIDATAGNPIQARETFAARGIDARRVGAVLSKRSPLLYVK